MMTCLNMLKKLYLVFAFKSALNVQLLKIKQHQAERFEKNAKRDVFGILIIEYFYIPFEKE